VQRKHGLPTAPRLSAAKRVLRPAVVSVPGIVLILVA
jgi:hypothetical protein